MQFFLSFFCIFFCKNAQNAKLQLFFKKKFFLRFFNFFPLDKGLLYFLKIHFFTKKYVFFIVYERQNHINCNFNIIEKVPAEGDFLGQAGQTQEIFKTVGV